MSIMKDSYAERFGCSFVENGGVATALGFKACGIHAGFREDPNRVDMALVIADEPCAAAGMFTQNVFCAAPVSICREHLNEGNGLPDFCDNGEGNYYGCARALMVNSGVANAATGEIGMKAARTSAHLLANELGCPDDEVLIASTGVIGVHLPLDPFETGIPVAVAQASRDGGALAACAIMTTDTHSKECAVTFSGDDIGYPGVTFSVGGMAKGSGMIMPQMATMIAALTTDAPIAAPDLSFALKNAVNLSFNKITVDSDTSTNDSCFLLASGAAVNGQNNLDTSSGDRSMFARGSDAFDAFGRALNQVCSALARAMVIDGEGATRLISVNVRGAASEEDADAAARAVANSPLTKTAIYGHDANWGRIAAALGKSGACFSQENVDIDIMGLPVCRKGLTVVFDEDEARARFEEPEIVIDADLGEGDCETTVWTCDLSHEYVSINGDYRS